MNILEACFTPRFSNWNFIRNYCLKMMRKLSLQSLHVESFTSMGLAIVGLVFSLKQTSLSSVIKTF